MDFKAGVISKDECVGILCISQMKQKMQKKACSDCIQ